MSSQFDYLIRNRFLEKLALLRNLAHTAEISVSYGSRVNFTVGQNAYHIASENFH